MQDANTPPCRRPPAGWPVVLASEGRSVPFQGARPILSLAIHTKPDANPMQTRCKRDQRSGLHRGCIGIASRLVWRASERIGLAPWKGTDLPSLPRTTGQIAFSLPGKLPVSLAGEVGGFLLIWRNQSQRAKRRLWFWLGQARISVFGFLIRCSFGAASTFPA